MNDALDCCDQITGRPVRVVENTASLVSLNLVTIDEPLHVWDTFAAHDTFQESLAVDRLLAARHRESSAHRYAMLRQKETVKSSGSRFYASVKSPIARASSPLAK